MKRILFVLCFVFAKISAGYTQVLTQDSLALVALHQANTVPMWINNKPGAPMDQFYDDTWLKKNVSEWLGVSVVNNRVESLDLSYAQLTGSLPNEFCNLTGLVNLNLGYNTLNGTFPVCINDFVNLRTLRLAGNEFTGDFPPIMNLPELRIIDISSNKFVSFPDVSGMTLLEQVIIHNNFLTIENILQVRSVPGIIYSPQQFFQDTSNPVYDLSVYESFSLSVTHPGGVNYQWEHYSQNIIDDERFSGAKTNTLINNSTRVEDDGYYSCLVTNPIVPEMYIKIFINNRVTITDRRVEQLISIQSPASMFCGDTLSLVSTNTSGLPVSYKLMDGTPLTNEFAPARDIIYDIIAYHEGNSTYLAASDTLELQVLTHSPVPVFTIENDLPIYKGEELTLSVQDVPGLSYLWRTPGGQTYSTSDLTIPAVSVSHQGTYRVQISEGSCLYDTLSLEVNLSIDSNVVIYELITPNGDGDNETFYVKNIENIPPADVTIYNEGSQVVYHQKQYANDWSGDDLPVGTYFYQLRVDAWDKVYKGNLYIKR